MSEKQLAIEVKGLRKTFGDLKAVRGVDLSINKGEIFGFVGPNGSGKTTTIRMLCGLLTPDEGEGRCMGYNILTESSKIKRNIGYMTQHYTLYKDMTVYENLKFMADLYRIKNKKEKIDYLLEELHLTDRIDQISGTLSGGWKQRLTLAATLLHDPKVLLLDEPTSAVDLQARREFWTQIEKLTAKGVTALVSTQFMDEVNRCHRLAYISSGQIMAVGTAENIINQSPLEAWFIKGRAWHQLFAEFEKDFFDWQMTPQRDGLHVVVAPNTKLPDVSKHGLKWERTDLTFEDVFVGLVQNDIMGQI